MIETTPSETATTNRLVLGPWASRGSQATTPLEESVNPSGPESSRITGVCLGRSVSNATTFSTTGLNSGTRTSPSSVRVGGELDSRTTKSTVLVTSMDPSLKARVTG